MIIHVPIMLPFYEVNRVSAYVTVRLISPKKQFTLFQANSLTKRAFSPSEKTYWFNSEYLFLYPLYKYQLMDVYRTVSYSIFNKQFSEEKNRTIITVNVHIRIDLCFCST